MAITIHKEQGNGGLKVIKVEGGKEKEKEVMVRHEMIFSKWKKRNNDYFLQGRNKIYSV